MVSLTGPARPETGWGGVRSQSYEGGASLKQNVLRFRFGESPHGASLHASFLKSWRPCSLRRTCFSATFSKIEEEVPDQARTPSPRTCLPLPYSRQILPNSPHDFGANVPYHFSWPFRAHNSPGHSLSLSNPNLQGPRQKEQGPLGSHCVCQARLESRSWFPSVELP